MCLHTGLLTLKEAKKLKKKPLIAKEDIIVYKVLTWNYKSPYYKFQYRKGYHYSENLNVTLITFSSGAYLSVNDGLHAFLCKESSKWTSPSFKSVKMVVPKGAKYYISASETKIVSDQLIWY